MVRSNRSKDLKDKEVSNIVAKELARFKKLVKGHEKLLDAIGRL